MLRVMAPTLTAWHSSGLQLDVKSATITLDEGTIPYGSATLTCAAPDGAALQAIDPRAGQRVTFELDDRADLFGGVELRRSFDLALVNRQYGAAGGELQLSLATDEQLLIDAGLLLNNVKDWGATTARSLAAKVLADRGFTLTAGPADALIDPAAAVQSPGQSFLDFLDGTLQGANLRLWCDELRVWRLDDKGTIAPGICSLDYRGTITGLNDAIALDANFADAVVVKYTYATDAGNVETAYDAFGDTSSRRVTVIPFSSRPAVDGAARRLLRRITGRGRVLSTEAVSRFDVTPTQSFAATLPDGAPVQTGLVSAVTWQIPSDRMTVRSRELTDTTSEAWAAQGAGRTWQSVPAGVSWRAVDAIAWTRGAVGAGWDDVAPGYRWDEMGEYVNG